MGYKGIKRYRNTRLSESDGWTVVRLHYTDIVMFNGGDVVLNSGGWKTSTTKRRMNEASAEFNLGFTVWQKYYNWFVDFEGKTYEFTDGMKLCCTRP